MVEQERSIVVNAVTTTESGFSDANDEGLSQSMQTERLLMLHPGQHFRRYFFGNDNFTSRADGQRSSPVHVNGSIFQSSSPGL